MAYKNIVDDEQDIQGPNSSSEDIGGAGTSEVDTNSTFESNNEAEPATNDSEYFNDIKERQERSTAAEEEVLATWDAGAGAGSDSSGGVGIKS